MDPVTAQHHPGSVVKLPRRGIKSWPRPKNGQYHVVLIAGGTLAHARDVATLFAERRATLVRYHWDYEKQNQWRDALPSDVDFVIYWASAISHSWGDKVVKAAKAAGVPLIRTTHKWANMVTALNARFGPQPGGKGFASLPLHVKSVAYLREGPEIAAEPTPSAPAVVHQALDQAQKDVATLRAAIEEQEREEARLLRKARLEQARKDTMTLVREIQARLAAIGPEATCMIDQREVTFYTGRVHVEPVETPADTKIAPLDPTPRAQTNGSGGVQ